MEREQAHSRQLAMQQTWARGYNACLTLGGVQEARKKRYQRQDVTLGRLLDLTRNSTAFTNNTHFSF